MKFLKAENSQFARRLVILIGACFLLFSGGQTFAADACPIKTSTADALAKYITNLNNTLADLNEKASKVSCEKNSLKWDINAWANDITRYTNRWLSGDNPLVSGKFWVESIMQGEVPYGVNRDLKMLKNKQEAINNAFDRIANKCALDLASGNEKYPTIGQYLGALLENHVRIMRIYKQSVIGDPFEPTTGTYLLVDGTDFESQLSQAYGPKALENCRKKEDYWKKISDAMNRIGNGGGSYSKGVQEWKDAWALLTGNDKKSRDKEREVLAKELAREWLSTSAAKRVLRNLDTYNQTDEHRGISGFVWDVGVAMGKLGNIIQNAYTKIAEALATSKSTDEYINRKIEFRSLSSGIGYELATDYEKMKTLIGGDTLISDENLAHLIDTHVLLKETGETLQKYEKVSTSACNSVRPGEWSCRGE